ncbi:Spc97/Spc98 family protein [Sodiomyces alkalinus F11]|uniref:Spindle pole body component n=1 Tax=Sodiomyces alkalinus (strain CBS 110278 / VKM F-3762 / F11) TaxID=1314773 RepID=A0A3N2PXJ2_SODAK|nr:Spc97/Spc98 family protein [Sodiomyces alkalinus F11]ROT39136.1 Spc97/Spc98 family protein [Sodiomyces alkalinus F11]
MTHLAKLSALTDELVELITATSSKVDRDRFNLYRESSIRSLRHHNFLRTNQFDVEERLDGLEERFRIQHREGLADALGQRLSSLALVPSKWHPEILHFLLEVADQPAQKSALAALDLLKEPDVDPGPRLTWEDIAKEDGWHGDPDLWRNVDYLDSSDDGLDDAKSATSRESEDTSLSALDTSHDRKPEDLQVATENHAALKAVRESQSWRLPRAEQGGTVPSRKVPVTEFQVIREVLFMLQGHPTSLFLENRLPDTKYQMANVAWETHRALSNWFAEAGRQLSVLRSFESKQQTSPLLQRFRSNVSTSLQSLDKHISTIQCRLVDAQEDTVVSLIAIQQELKPLLDPLYSLSNVVREQQEYPNIGAFRYLELLYHQIGAAQASDCTEGYQLLGRIFFDCFQVYLRPIRHWMEEGELIPGDKIFFVSESSAQLLRNQIWRDQFKLRRTSSGQLHVPNFLQPSAAKIFTAGKSIVVLKHLGWFERSRKQWTHPEPHLTFDAVCSAELGLAPFSELFGSAFHSWVQSKQHATSEALKQVLMESCRLQANADALERLYFMSDGAVADTYCQNLFARIDLLRTDWRDRYFLAGLAQESFSPCLDAHLVTSAMTPNAQRIDPVQARDSVRALLPMIGISYRLSWPVQIVLTDETLARYQAVFTFLLQIRRATSVLKRPRLLDKHTYDTDNGAENVDYYDLRFRFLWFCNCLQTYLATLVLAPSMEKLRRQFQEAHDVDTMIAVHSDLTKQVTDAACLGSKLDPIRDAILDVLDLAIRLAQEEARKDAQNAREKREFSRMSVMVASPLRGSPKTKGPGSSWRSQDGDGDDDHDHDDDGFASPAAGSSFREKSYIHSLREISADYNRHLRFICGGLRGAARASGKDAAVKWDMLAEMLEAGIPLIRGSTWIFPDFPTQKGPYIRSLNPCTSQRDRGNPRRVELYDRTPITSTPKQGLHAAGCGLEWGTVIRLDKNKDKGRVSANYHHKFTQLEAHGTERWRNGGSILGDVSPRNGPMNYVSTISPSVQKELT